ncbi:MAG: Gfo/Idh/MocA family protein [Neoaquamicrobium sediminum]|uniref:Gfo/Idh/MocA family protein n=1 Tax=Neoaquamicrobium sediminum TaxID=1849104 RepID=UPI0040375510
MADARRSVLICGFGAFGALHAKAWRVCDPSVRLMVSDPSEAARGEAIASGVEPVAVDEDPATLMPQADIVDVVAPPAYHLPLALQALSLGKPVLLEKPAVRSLGEAQALVQAAGTVPVQIGLVLRCHPLVRRARDLLAAGAIGKLLLMEGDFSGWKRMRADSSLIENDGVHFIDLMRHFAGAPVSAVDAVFARHLEPAVVDDIRIDLAFGNGIEGRLRLGVLAGGLAEDGFVPGAMTSKSLRLVGSTGNLVLDFNANRLFHGTVEYRRSPGGFDVMPQGLTSEAAIGVTPVSLLARSFAIFGTALDGGGPVMCDLHEGALEMARVIERLETCASRSRQLEPVGDAA